MKTLKDVMPFEFETSFQDTRAYKFRHVEVVAQHGDIDDANPVRWPGSHKYANYWVELANGYAVGWNENPGRGWSFPVVRMRKDTK